MDPKLHRVYLDRDLPVGCWHNIFQFSGPPEIAQAAAVNQSCRAASYDDRLWYPHFKKELSPEYCGSLRTGRDGKNFCSLYNKWRSGKPAAVDLIPRVHGPEIPLSAKGWRPAVHAIQLSQAGALAAWSVGGDHALVGIDVTTCQILKRCSRAVRPCPCVGSPGNPHVAEGILPQRSGYGLNAVVALDSIACAGLVCAAGGRMTGWDPRQRGRGRSTTPAFNVDYLEATGDVWVGTMISAASPDCNGPPQLLTGGPGCMVYLWDLRFIDGGPVRHYEANTDGVSCLAREPRHGTLLAGGRGCSREYDRVGGGITCWNWETGAQLSYLWDDRGPAVDALAVGRDRLVSVGFPSLLREWAIPEPHGVVGESEPELVGTLGCREDHRIFTKSMQGLGEGPDWVMVGTGSGYICMWECGKNPEQLPVCWSLGYHTCPGASLRCLAAIDQVVINGFSDGAVHIVRVDTQCTEHGD